MEVILDKEDLISLVKGACPYYDVFDHPLVKMSGVYRGGFRDEWNWDEYKLKKLSEKSLLELYFICKKSWEGHK